MNTTTPTEQPAPLNEHPVELTQRRLAELANAYGRYSELTERLKSPIVTPETATLQAERAGLEKFLGSALLVHANQLLGCYHIVHSEYEPVLKSIAIIARRIGLIPVLEAKPEQEGIK